MEVMKVLENVLIMVIFSNSRCTAALPYITMTHIPAGTVASDSAVRGHASAACMVAGQEAIVNTT